MKNQPNLRDIKVLAFDADDTLWDNQSYYDNAEEVLMIGNSLPYSESEAMAFTSLLSAPGSTRSLKNLNTTGSYV